MSYLKYIICHVTQLKDDASQGNVGRQFKERRAGLYCELIKAVSNVAAKKGLEMPHVSFRSNRQRPRAIKRLKNGAYMILLDPANKHPKDLVADLSLGVAIANGARGREAKLCQKALIMSAKKVFY
jgi:hypothetical protein